MASIFKGLLKRVVKIRVEGAINQALTDKILTKLRSAEFYTPEVVLITVNSQGGSISQARHISDVVRNYAMRKSVPVYCFAEDHCLGSANIVLTSGVKSYANEMSIIGDWGFTWGSLWFDKFAQKYKVKQQYIYSGDNKVKFNPFEQLKPQNEKWMQNNLYHLQHQLKTIIITQRQNHFVRKQFDNQKIQKQVFGNTAIEPNRAVEVGLIDGIMNYDDMIRAKFDGVKVLEINKRSNFEKHQRTMSILGIEFAQ